MFRWLTRNDGRRAAAASRRLRSARGAVFAEFALVMPLVVLLCSALIEFVGFWDAQVMANHTAWTVGRIAMVRGADGMVFSKTIDKGDEGMPTALQVLLALFPEGKQFNNRGNIATLFLMSTCGIGYYGSSPGAAVAKKLDDLINSGVKALTESLPKWLEEAVKNITLPSFIPGGESGIAGFVNELVKGIMDKVVELALKPIAEGLASLLKAAVENIIGKDGIKIDDLFNGEGEAARFARQIYGSAARIAKAKSTTGKEVLTVTAMDDLKGGFIFAKRSNRGRLAYPQVVDKEAKSDGYFVTGAHGWPANDQGLAMLHVEINWPYERGWLFPVVSGRVAASSTNTPVATGHSMVFPQPAIENKNLYSEGATAFNPGSYTNNASMADLDDLANEMKHYLMFVKFCMRYRICEDTLTLKDGVYRVVPAQYWKYIQELKDLWPFDTGSRDSYPRGGDYGKCWSAVTGGKSQDTVTRNLKSFFNKSAYRSKDYFYWDGAYHKRYGQDLCDKSGNAGLGKWYDSHASQNYRDNSANLFTKGLTVVEFASAWQKHQAELKAAFPQGVDVNDMYQRVTAFAKRNHVNVCNLVKWQVGLDLEAWKAQDRATHDMAVKAEKSFKAIRDLIHAEIRDIEDMENGTSSWTGNEDDPVLDPNDEEVMRDPSAAARKARAKWAALKKDLKAKLAEVDAAAEAARKEWEAYKNAVARFTADREQASIAYFAEASVNILVRTGNKRVFDAENDASFRIPAGCMPYDIGAGTREMLARATAFYNRLDEAYKREVEYGAMLGLQSAGEAKRSGRSPDEVVDEAEKVSPDNPGSLAPGSDTGAIINQDRQEFSGGEWQWK